MKFFTSVEDQTGSKLILISLLF